MAIDEGMREQARAGRMPLEGIAAHLATGNLTQPEARELWELALKAGVLMNTGAIAPVPAGFTTYREFPEGIDREIQYLLWNTDAVTKNIGRAGSKDPANRAFRATPAQNEIEKSITRYAGYGIAPDVSKFGPPGGLANIPGGDVSGRTGPPPTYQGPLKFTQGPPTVLPEEMFGGFPAYSRGLERAGLPTGTMGGPFGSFLRGRFNPTEATFLGGIAARGDPGPYEDEAGGPYTRDAYNAFANFVSGAGGMGLGRQASESFQSLLDLQRGGPGSGSEYAQKFIAPDAFADYQLGAGLGLEAARGKIGGFAASRLLPSREDLAYEWLGGPRAMNQAEYLDWVNRKLGLGYSSPWG